MRAGGILCERGTRNDPDNIQQRPQRIDVKLHIAAWVNWYKKAEKLEFYNDEESFVQRPKRPSKPRTRKYESQEEYKVQLAE